MEIQPAQVLAIILNSLGIESGPDITTVYNHSQQVVLTSIRAPRMMLCILVGAGLVVSGATLQGLFRNPLADPSIIGVSSGAALAAASVIVLGATFFTGIEYFTGQYVLPIATFGGGMVTTLLVFQLGTRNGFTSASTVLLGGIAINAIASAGIGLLMYLADDEQL
ncbi:MAG: iron complex transport system permease protein [Gammaproteobacteria bacterium]